MRSYSRPTKGYRLIDDLRAIGVGSKEKRMIAGGKLSLQRVKWMERVGGTERKVEAPLTYSSIQTYSEPMLHDVNLIHP
jgi:hypothetical protein